MHVHCLSYSYMYILYIFSLCGHLLDTYTVYACTLPVIFSLCGYLLDTYTVYACTLSVTFLHVHTLHALTLWSVVIFNWFPILYCALSVWWHKCIAIILNYSPCMYFIYYICIVQTFPYLVYMCAYNVHTYIYVYIFQALSESDSFFSFINNYVL